MKKPKMIDGVPHIRINYTDSCSGCFEFNEGLGLSYYEYDQKARCYKGGGCSECGYTGKRRHDFWMPDFTLISYDEYERGNVVYLDKPIDLDEEFL